MFERVISLDIVKIRGTSSLLLNDALNHIGKRCHYAYMKRLRIGSIGSLYECVKSC